ncbi:hypothetical protein DICPUDRAFT_76992 [Dictyostelium purpureum]|uniref:Septum site-determining protein MinC n=1 Tax=Dictyostelium purpureum TaxID=5786 RepID=F0ZFA1_DICPU|nr:uncharacterized protein DICPUDRAFT_76992 [Dictyostelium purpureum]EGC37370.1 hypothetical protein DICPUDRAFT_76992 [Dictyostelium purpureum]|eukprot:XP_003286111.1 hypothetical protein DICPUDRAFT_76992 [Dictyostelium purpureum]
MATIITKRLSFILNNTINKKFYSTGLKSNEAILKSKPYLITTLKINKNETNDQILQNLKNKISLSPSFYNNAPIVLDISEYEKVEINQIEQLFQLCESNGLLPIGISSQNSSKDFQDSLKNFKLPLLSPKLGFSNESHQNILTNQKEKINNENNINNNNKNNYSTQMLHPQSQSQLTNNISSNINNDSGLNSNKPNPLIITSSLRSGQQAYAKNGADLIVMGNVHSGAEAIADGNIYIFGSLKGRANAGVNGDRRSKIIVNRFQAELVSIASIYHACEVQPRLLNPKNPTTIELNDSDKLIFSSTNDLLTGNI